MRHIIAMIAGFALLVAGLLALQQAPIAPARAGFATLLGAGKPTAAGCSAPALPGTATNVIGRWLASCGTTTSGGNVTAVADQSGNGNDLSVGGTVPYAASSSYNSNPAWDFQALGTLYNNSFPAGGTQNFSVFAIGIMASGTETFGGFYGYYGGSSGNDYDNSNSFVLSRNATNNNIFNTSSSGSATPTAITPGDKHTFATVTDTVGNATLLYLDGVDTMNYLFSVVPTLTNNRSFFIGNRFVGGSYSTGNRWYGPVLEVIFANVSYNGTAISDLNAYAISTYGAL